MLTPDRLRRLHADSGRAAIAAFYERRPCRMRFRFRDALHLLLASLLLIAPPALAQKMISIGSEKANWRTGPGTQYPVDWILGRGYPLEILGKRGDWLHVRDFERDEGWIYRPLASDSPRSIVKVKIAYLRKRPTTGSRILARLSYGEVVVPLEDKVGWVKVRRDSGLRGWVARRLLWGR